MSSRPSSLSPYLRSMWVIHMGHDTCVMCKDTSADRTGIGHTSKPSFLGMPVGFSLEATDSGRVSCSPVVHGPGAHSNLQPKVSLEVRNLSPHLCLSLKSQLLPR